jgi:hypothetical protein
MSGQPDQGQSSSEHFMQIDWEASYHRLVAEHQVMRKDHLSVLAAARAVVAAEGPSSSQRGEFWSAIDALRALLLSRDAGSEGSRS